jgi:hypothetical protein
MHPVIWRIRAIKAAHVRRGWAPERVVLGWLTYDLLRADMGRKLPHPHHSGSPGRGYLLGFEVVRDPSFPLGGSVTLERDDRGPDGGRRIDRAEVPLSG